MSFGGTPVTTDGVMTLTGILGVANGGTGSNTAPVALANLGGASSYNAVFTGYMTLPNGGTLSDESGFNKFSNATRNGSTTRNQKIAADASQWVEEPRIFAQAGDPGAAAADGDIWCW